MTEGLANPNLRMMVLLSHNIIVLRFEHKLKLNENRLKIVFHVIK